MVQRVFSLTLFFLILSCKTYNVNNVEFREISLTKKNINLNLNTSLILKNKRLDPHKKIEPGSISTIYLNGSDLWIGKLGGALVRYNLYTGETKSFQDDIYSIKDYSIKKILETTDHIIALQSDRIIKIEKEKELLEIIPFPSEINRGSDIVIYKEKYYISTLGYGLLEYDPTNSKFKNIIKDLSFLTSLELDNNTLYIGSMRNGLYSFNIDKLSLNSRLNFPLSLFKKNVTKLMKRGDTLWLGTAKSGLIKWNLKTNIVQKIYPGEGVSFIYGNPKANAVSFIGHGIYIESGRGESLESIETSLLTNNITSVAVFNNKLITGNLKKGIIKQELTILND